MDHANCKRRRRVQILTALVVTTSVAVLVIPRVLSGASTEMTPAQTNAMRGCIEGFDPASDRDLSPARHIAACDTFVALSDDKVGATYSRALHLYENAKTPDDHTKAYRDFTTVIDAGTNIPSAYANRAMINVLVRSNPREALADITKAIELKADAPRVRYYEKRALVLVHLARQEVDAKYILAAQDDLNTVLDLSPANKTAKKIQKHIDQAQQLIETTKAGGNADS